MIGEKVKVFRCSPIFNHLSPGAKAAVEAVAARRWREGSEIRLVEAISEAAPTTIGRFVQPLARWLEDEVTAESEWNERLAENSLRTLNDAGITAALRIASGNPKQVLIEEAEKWHADSIFVGANSFGSSLERFPLGGTSAAATAEVLPA